MKEVFFEVENRSIGGLLLPRVSIKFIRDCAVVGGRLSLNAKSFARKSSRGSMLKRLKVILCGRANSSYNSNDEVPKHLVHERCNVSNSFVYAVFKRRVIIIIINFDEIPATWMLQGL